MARESYDNESEVVTRQKPKTKKPQMYKVILHNDDYTSMEFVVMVLETIFHKTPVLATQIMLKIHKEGSGVCGVFTRDVAETKVRQVEDLAMEYGYPLLCTMEQA